MKTRDGGWCNLYNTLMAMQVWITGSELGTALSCVPQVAFICGSVIMYLCVGNRTVACAQGVASSSSIGSDKNVSVQEHVPAQPSKLRNLAEIVQQQS